RPLRVPDRHTLRRGAAGVPALGARRRDLPGGRGRARPVLADRRPGLLRYRTGRRSRDRHAEPAGAVGLPRRDGLVDVRPGLVVRAVGAARLRSALAAPHPPLTWTVPDLAPSVPGVCLSVPVVGLEERPRLRRRAVPA